MRSGERPSLSAYRILQFVAGQKILARRRNAHQPRRFPRRGSARRNGVGAVAERVNAARGGPVLTRYKRFRCYMWNQREDRCLACREYNRLSDETGDAERGGGVVD